MWDWLCQNVQWVFSGIGVAIVAAIGGVIWRRHRKGATWQAVNGDSSVATQAGHNAQVSETRSDQQQRAGPGSFNIQAKVVNIGQALTIEDVKSIAKTVFESNFPVLANLAKEEAQRRFELAREEVLKQVDAKLSAREIDRFAEPDVQYKLFEVLREGSRTKSDELRKTLASLLVSRVKSEENDFRKIVYNEAISAVPRLTLNQVKILVAVAAINNIQHGEVLDWESFKANTIDRCWALLQFAPKASDFSHLEYTGCISVIRLGSFDAVERWRRMHSGAFQETVGEAEYLETGLPADAWSAITRSEPNGQGYRFLASNKDILEKALGEMAASRPQTATPITEDICQKVIGLYRNKILPKDECRKRIRLYEPGGQLLDKIDKSIFLMANLTSVGIVIAVTELERLLGEPVNIDGWIEEAAITEGAKKKEEPR